MKNVVSSRARLPLLVFVLLLVLAPLVLSPYYITMLNGIGLSSLVVLGLVLLTGVAGLTSFGQAAFVGMGAYISAALTTSVIELPAALNWLHSPWAALLVALVCTALLALLLGALTLKLSGHYLPLGTIAWGISLYYVFGTLQSMGGQTGMSGIPPISLFGLALTSDRMIYGLIWVAVLAAAFGLMNLLDSREGRAIRALKGGIVMAEAMGIDTARSRIVIFVLAALLASLSGWLYVHMQRFVNPSPFGLQVGIDYLFMAVLGGASYIWGAVLGAGVITLLREWLQGVLPSLLGRSGNFETIFFGLLMVLMLQRSREGIWPFFAGLVARLGTRLPKHKQSATAAQWAEALPLPRRSMPNPNEVVLDVRDVTRRFGGLVANNQMNLKVFTGEVLALIGPNGAGKSTLFNQISGVDTPTSGTVLFRGYQVTGKGSRHIAGLGMSRSFQHVRLLPHDGAGKCCHRRAYARQARRAGIGVAAGSRRRSAHHGRSRASDRARRSERADVRTGRVAVAGAATDSGNRPCAGVRSLFAAAG
jgi:ABC-type branched-subunit amino acid transport system permease subunit